MYSTITGHPVQMEQTYTQMSAVYDNDDILGLTNL